MKGSREEPFRSAELEKPAVKAALLDATERWRERCNAEIEKNGDHGTCVLGAGIAVYVLEPRKHYPRRRVVIHAHEVCRVQGASVWEESVRDIVKLLVRADIEAFYECGSMD